MSHSQGGGKNLLLNSTEQEKVAHKRRIKSQHMSALSRIESGGAANNSPWQRQQDTTDTA